MRPLTDARRRVLEAMPRMPHETVSVTDAVGRVTAAPVVAQEAIPPFGNSAMDGFAVRAADIAAAPIQLRVLEDVPAGSVPTMTVTEGTATRIMTGAPVPDGADTIVLVESTSMVASDVVLVSEAFPVGTSVRPRGSDVQPGDTIVRAGVRLTPRHTASIGTVGVAPTVAIAPTVAVMATGDELRPPGSTDIPVGSIRDTNRPMLLELLAALSVPTIDMGIIGDDPDELRAAYSDAAARSDMIVSTGGVSMGDYDFVKQVLGEAGDVDFWRVAMQPAKPFAFGSFEGTPLLGLPGNPVSTFVAFEQFVRPALLTMMGANLVLRPRIPGVMGEDVSTNPEKEVFVRAILAEDEGRFVALRAGGQGSHMLSSLAAADAFAVVPVGTGDLSAGDAVTLEMFTWPENRSADG